jgi:hypothetical protein
MNKDLDSFLFAYRQYASPQTLVTLLRTYASVPEDAELRRHRYSLSLSLCLSLSLSSTS